MKKKGSTDEQIIKRQEKLREILDSYRKQNIKPTNEQLLTDLRNGESGYDISIRTLTEDKVELARGNTFVSDVAKKTYSQIINDCYDALEFIEQKAREILDKKWTQSKQITKKSRGGNEITEHLTAELADPRLRALSIIADAVMKKAELVSGKTLDVSAALWIRQTKQHEDEIKNLKKQLEESLAKA